MPTCPEFDALGPYATELTAFVDCHAQALGEEGYNALAASSQVGAAIAGLLAIYIALIGYRLLLGETYGLKSGVSSAFTIGLVLALSTQWAAYKLLVYDVIIAAPQEVATEMLTSSSLGGDDRAGLIVRIQNVYTQIDMLLHPDPGLTEAASSVTPRADAPTALPSPSASMRTGSAAGVVPSPAVLSTASAFLLTGTLAGLLSVRVTAGVLLALGPLFIACFLFEATRGLFVGWIRALAGVFLSAIVVPFVLALELAVLEPQTQTLAAAVLNGDLVPILPGEIMVTAALFLLVMLSGIAAAVVAASAFRLPGSLRQSPTGFRRAEAPGLTTGSPATSVRTLEIEHSQSRAAAIADAVMQREQHETRTAMLKGQERTALHKTGAREAASTGTLPLGQQYRRTVTRRSAGAAKRDASL